MRIIVNIIAFITLVLQFIYFAFSAGNQIKSESIMDSLHNYSNVAVLMCSVFTVMLFICLYNFNCKFLKNKILNCMFLFIVILGPVTR